MSRCISLLNSSISSTSIARSCDQFQQDTFRVASEVHGFMDEMRGRGDVYYLGVETSSTSGEWPSSTSLKSYLRARKMNSYMNVHIYYTCTSMYAHRK